MKLIFTGITCLLLSHFSVTAQDVLNTDRPDQSDATHIIETHYLQVETGVQFSKTDALTHSFNNVTLIRYGVSKNFEVRLLNEYASIHDDKITAGIKPVSISFKNLLFAGRGLLPKLTLVTYFNLPVTISKAFKAEKFGYTINLAALNTLSPAIRLYSNIGIRQEQESAGISYLTALEINYTITKKINVFTEYFGNYAAGVNAANGLDIGFIYALKKNLSVDIAFGSPALQLNVSRYVSLGASMRFPK